MKQLKLNLFVFLLFPLSGISQSLVSTSVLPRNAVLEMFNGINCAYCPDGDQRADQLVSAFPGRVAVIIIHTGALADTLIPGQPDYRTPFGAAIDSMAGGNSYPSGTMNRVVWPGTYSQPPYFPQNPPDNLVIRRLGWWDAAYPTTGTGAAIILTGGNTPVNIGAESLWDDVTRELSVTVELYYTSSDTIDNKLNVALLENNIIGTQSTTAGYDSAYVHNHMLRHFLTGQWGDTVSTTQQGTLVSRTYTYTVPLNINIDNCNITVFVTQNNNKHTHTSQTVAAKNGTTVSINEITENTSPWLFPNPANDQITAGGWKEKNTVVTITTVTGQVVYHSKAEADYLTIPVSHFTAGLYFIHFSGDQQNTMKKFIVQE